CQEGRFPHALAGALGLGDLGAELERLRRDLAGNAPEMARRLDEYLARRLRDLQDMMKALVRQELDQQDVQRQDRQGLQSLAEKSFFYLTEEEIRRMEEAVNRLAQRLKNVVAIRRRRAKRGPFDSTQTPPHHPPYPPGPPPPPPRPQH